MKEYISLKRRFFNKSFEGQSKPETWMFKRQFWKNYRSRRGGLLTEIFGRTKKVRNCDFIKLFSEGLEMSETWISKMSIDIKASKYFQALSLVNIFESCEGNTVVFKIKKKLVRILS